MYQFNFFNTAYIDPATSGQIIAVITGVVITLGVTVGIMRTKIMMFFQKNKIARMEKKIIKENKKANDGNENN